MNGKNCSVIALIYCDHHRCKVRYSMRLFVLNHQADQSLYLAKDQGRDRVVIN